MRTNFSLTSSSPMGAEPEHQDICDDILDSSSSFRDLRRTVISSLICVVCIFGLVGNGSVIWLLGFRMKRNPFTTYILNLAVADFGVLIFSISIALLNIVIIQHPDSVLLFEPYVVSVVLFHCVYSTSQFLLTAISIDRCVAVLFPLWYRCHRPEKLSTVLCILIWLLSFLVQGICLKLQITQETSYETFSLMFYALLVNVVCLPLITVSTLILFIRFCFKSQQCQRGKLLTVILLTLFFFLIFAFPLNVIYLIASNPMSFYEDYLTVKCYDFIEYGWLCTSLNSFVNPLLYFLVGIKKRGLCRENLKLILRRVFKEEEEEEKEEEACREKPATQL